MSLPVAEAYIKSEYTDTTLLDPHYTYRPCHNDRVGIKTEMGHAMVYSEMMDTKAEPILKDVDIHVHTAHKENTANSRPNMTSDSFSTESSSMSRDQFLLFQQILDTLKSVDSDTDENCVNTSDEEYIANGYACNNNFAVANAGESTEFHINDDDDGGVDNCYNNDVAVVHACDNAEVVINDNNDDGDDECNTSATNANEGFGQKNVSVYLNKDHETKMSGKKYITTSSHKVDIGETKVLQEHVKATERNKSGYHSNRARGFGCEICFKEFNRKDYLENHSAIHNRERYACSRCNAAFRSICNMESHYQINHNVYKKIYTCIECSKTFVTYKGYYEHRDSHQGVRYPCEECGKDFSAKQTLKVHKKLHQPSKQSISGRHWADVGPISKYRPDVGPMSARYGMFAWDTYGSTLDLTCDVCQKMFVSKANLALHMQVHLGKQMYSCYICDAHFSRAADFKRHINIHTGEITYKCKQCPKTFRHSGDLGRHERLNNCHQTCKYCNKSYTRLDEFMRHLATHAKPEFDPFDKKGLFYCNICKSAYSSELAFKNHMKKNHPDIEEPTSVNSAYTESKAHKAPLMFPCSECSKVFTTNGSRTRHKRLKHTIQKQ